MDRKLVVQQSVLVQASPAAVWSALITPEIVKRYFFGTEIVSDWQVGSEIIFQGEWEGKAYKDKGIIQAIVPGHQLQYTYWSAMSGLPDEPQYYSTVSFTLEKISYGTRLSVSQQGFASKEAQVHARTGWQTVLQGLKDVMEGRR
ncbi:ATPase [Candidatus Woesearchaeota archaeon CG1_02_57_44]|nr:MAG: ATPase [Candidatus Woesearchaeota archaeon CG1_02_57_44]